jgi:hypothetical protein
MINTSVVFWYGWEIDETNYLLDFKYSSDVSDRQAELRFGRYSSTTLCTEIERAMAEVGTNAFAVTFSRTTRKFTISNASNFVLLSNTGASIDVDASALEYIGYAVSSDKTGTNTYTADNTCRPYVYTPQFKLQSFSYGHATRLRDVNVAETASGIVELAHFGVIEPVVFEIKGITDRASNGTVIANNPTGVADADRLMAWMTKKGLVEIIPDSNDPATYQDLILEATDQSQHGTEYELIEEYDRGLVGFYRTGKLKLRKYEE